MSARKSDVRFRVTSGVPFVSWRQHDFIVTSDSFEGKNYTSCKTIKEARAEALAYAETVNGEVVEVIEKVIRENKQTKKRRA